MVKKILAALIVVLSTGVIQAAPKNAPLDNVVRLRRNSVEGSAGSGFILRSGLVVTAKHCVKGAKAIYVGYSDGTYEKVSMWHVTMSKGHDLAYIKTSKHTHGVKNISISSRDNYIGREVYMVSMPGTFNVRWVTQGIVASGREEFSGYGGNWKNIRMIDVAGRSGCSGSPVFDSHSDTLVGVFVGDNRPHICIMIDIVELREFLK